MKTFLAHKEVNVCFAKMGVIMKSSYCTMFSSVKPQRHFSTGAVALRGLQLQICCRCRICWKHRSMVVTFCGASVATAVLLFKELNPCFATLLRVKRTLIVFISSHGSE